MRKSGHARCSKWPIETPEQQIAGLAEQNRLLAAKVDALQAELDIQKALVAELLKRLYGAKSEKMSHDQLLMEFLRDEAKKPEAAAGAAAPPAADKDPAAPAKRRAPRTNKLSDSLKGLPTVVRQIIQPAVLAAPDDYRLIGEEISERLHVSPAAFSLEIIKRLTHVLKRDPDAVPVTPPLEPCLLPGSVLTPSLGAYLLTQKFCYHSPFYREEWKLRAAHGIELTRNLMCSWHDHLADRLLPLYDSIAANFRTATYIKVDETPIRCLEPGKGKAALGQFWVYHHAEHGVLFDWHKSRANTCLDTILIGRNGKPSFRGYLQSDGLRAYKTFIKRHPELKIIAVSCLAHIRREFYAARDDHPRITAWILNQIACIYRIEAALREQRVGPLERQKARWTETRRHYDRLTRLIAHLRKQREITPGSLLGKALTYAAGQWPALEPCFLDGQIEFDNNLTENAIRPTKLGMKNWMFIGREETGWRSAVIYTFVEQVRRHGMDPFAYFEWVFGKLMHNPAQEELQSLLPAAWLKAQADPAMPDDRAAA
ncbi:MAG: IS66 family transposase [Roseimicrobium sp.]